MKMSAFPQKTIVITSVPNQTARDLLSDDMDDIYGDGQGPRKRRRLTHLTPEEKMLRRKLKNRVAAQTARDRKKVLMTDLETKVAQLEAENRRLAKENSALKAQTGSLTLENVALKDRLSAAGGAPSRTESESGSAAGTGSDSVQLDCPVSAVSNDIRSDSFVSLLKAGLQQQQTTTRTQTVHGLTDNRVAMPTTTTDGLVGPTPKELDSFNELIQFDHVYYKSVPQSKLVPQNQSAPVQTIRRKKDNIGSDYKKIVPNNVQKVTENGCKNVKIIITSDPSNLKNGKIGEHNVSDQQVVTIPNVILDTQALQKVSNLKKLNNVSDAEAFDVTTAVQSDNILNIAENMDSEELMDLNFDLLEDLENIISADFEGLASSDTNSLLSCDQDNVITDTSNNQLKQSKGCKRKSPDSLIDPVTDLTASVPSPTKSLSSFTDSDYMSDTPSPYNSQGIASPIGDAESSPLGENLWEESFTELFPDLL